MNKKISELNISDEDKILLSRIERRIPFLSNKMNEYFENSIYISSDKIDEAYLINEDLMSILDTNNLLIEDLKKQSYEIRVKHQNNFTKEQTLDISLELTFLEKIENTLNKRDVLVKTKDKLLVLRKWENYIENRNPKRKNELKTSLIDLQNKMFDQDILEIEPLQEDLNLIKSLINPREIEKAKILYLIPIITILISILLIGFLIWKLVVA